MKGQHGVSLTELLIGFLIVSAMIAGSVTFASQVGRKSDELDFVVGFQSIVAEVQNYSRRPDGFQLEPFLNAIDLPSSWRVEEGTPFFAIGDEWIRTPYGVMQLRYYAGWPQSEQWRMRIEPDSAHNCVAVVRMIANKGWYIRQYNDTGHPYDVFDTNKLCAEGTAVVPYLSLFVQ